jgi:hypothetical protein
MGHCGKRIYYGERCPDCARDLRQRQGKKRRRR